MSGIANDGQAKEAFWASAARHALEAPYCSHCERFFFYPRPFCPSCWSDKVEFRPVAGFGTIWTYTIVRFAHGNAAKLREVPYAVALVTLDEGIRLMGNIVECPLDQIRSGMRVRLTYVSVGGRELPAYAPALIGET